MDEAEKKLVRETVARYRAGHEAVKRERLRSLREMNHLEWTPRFEDMVLGALKLPHRSSSWMVDYYQKLQKACR